MKIGKAYYFNKYATLSKFLLVVVVALLFICCHSKHSQKVLTPKSGKLFSENSININTATAKDLEKLPNIGEKTALNIIEYRQKYGRFRKPEHLLLVQGISEKKFREMKNFLKTE